jgi:hypothetical protein
MKKFLLFPSVLLWASLSPAQTITYASNYLGADGGAKINAAERQPVLDPLISG